LGAVGEAGGASEVELAGRVQHHTVADDDSMDVGVTGQGGEHLGGDLDGNGELGGGAVVSGGVGVDHRDEFGPPRP
jgi:hypothetical protein